ncbi:MAG: TolC family protein, partial [Deltaproteobacteria bacterium]|nr:TolC family protein [Kofleriaceae bacterium]
MRRALHAIVSLLGVMLVACTPHRVTRAPAPPIDTPPEFAGASAGGAVLPDRWWTVFGDPELDALVTRALGGNFD